MLFIGHFSFDEVDDAQGQRHGYFSSLVDADSPDDAVAKFESYIRQMKTDRREMIGVVNIYIEEILKIETIPSTPIVTRLQSSAGAFPASISHSLPDAENQCVDVFGYAPDVDKQERPGEGRYVEAEPFITFDD